jgi:hypothetical protein
MNASTAVDMETVEPNTAKFVAVGRSGGRIGGPSRDDGHLPSCGRGGYGARRGASHNDFKIELAKRTLCRTLALAAQGG